MSSGMALLKNDSTTSKATLRPIITFINGDVSWLVSFPRPLSDQTSSGKTYYHTVVDPWFGQQSVVFSSLVLTLRLGRDAGLSDRADIDAAIVELERTSGNSYIPTDTCPATDAIFITALAEHCNQESLLQFSKSTPVFAVAAAANTIGAWGHFNTVVTMSSCDPSTTSWKEGHPGSPLPAWLTAFPPAVTRINNFGLVLITTASHSEGELILMAPHGISADEAFLQGLATSTKALALVAPLKDSYAFGVQTVLGVKDGLGIGQTIGMQYYVRSGDFVSLKYGGAMSWFLSDVPRDLQWGISELRKGIGSTTDVKEPTMVEVENGGRFVLV